MIPEHHLTAERALANAMFEAIREDDLDKLLSLIPVSPEDRPCPALHCRTLNGKTLLHFASELGNPKIVEALINAGVKTDEVTEDGITAVMIAAKNGHEKVIEALAKAGANHDVRDANGFTTLNVAAVLGYEKVIEVLVKAGAKLNESDPKGFTALMRAAQLGREKVIEVLVKAGANLDMTDPNGHTALIVAAATSDNEKVIEALVRAGAKLDERNSVGFTALSLAGLVGHEKVVGALFKAGAKLEVTDRDDFTVLFIAIRQVLESLSSQDQGTPAEQTAHLQTQLSVLMSHQKSLLESESNLYGTLELAEFTQFLDMIIVCYTLDMTSLGSKKQACPDNILNLILRAVVTFGEFHPDTKAPLLMHMLKHSLQYSLNVWNSPSGPALFTPILTMTMFNKVFSELCDRHTSVTLHAYAQLSTSAVPNSLDIAFRALSRVMRKCYTDRDPTVSRAPIKCLNLARHLLTEFQKIENTLDFYSLENLRSLPCLIEILEAKIQSPVTKDLAEDDSIHEDREEASSGTTQPEQVSPRSGV